MMSRYPDELRADFQQYYGLNIDGMGADYSVTHAAVLAVMLPLGARVPSKADPSLEWSLDRQLAAATANAVRDLHWAMAGGGEADRPERIGPPAPKREDIEEIYAEDYIEELARLRRCGDGD